MKTHEFQGQLAVGRRYGLLLGIVANVDDPEKLGRIKVQFDFVDEVSDWAYRSVPIDSYDARVPKIGQTVTVFAVDGDLHNLVYTGVLQNDMNPSLAGKDSLRVDVQNHDAIFRENIKSGSQIKYDGVTITFVPNGVSININGLVTYFGSDYIELKSAGRNYRFDSAGLRVDNTLVALVGGVDSRGDVTVS